MRDFYPTLAPLLPKRTSSGQEILISGIFQECSSMLILMLFLSVIISCRRFRGIMHAISRNWNILLNKRNHVRPDFFFICLFINLHTLLMLQLFSNHFGHVALTKMLAILHKLDLFPTSFFIERLPAFKEFFFCDSKILSNSSIF